MGVDTIGIRRIGLRNHIRRKLIGAWSTLTDGTTTFRREIRDGYLCLDKTLTATGFAGLEDTDWTTVKAINLL